MMTFFPTAQASQELQNDPVLNRAHQKAVARTRLPQKRAEQMTRCAGYLSANGFGRRNKGVYGLTAKKYRKARLRSMRTMATTELQSVGILPGGIGWLFVRWFVIPYLTELIREWLCGGRDG